MIIQQGYSSYSLPCGKGLTTTTTVPVRYRRGRHIFCYFCLRLDKLYIAFLVRVEQKQDAQPGDKPIQHHRQHNLSLSISLSN